MTAVASEALKLYYVKPNLSQDWQVNKKAKSHMGFKGYPISKNEQVIQEAEREPA